MSIRPLEKGHVREFEGFRFSIDSDIVLVMNRDGKELWRIKSIDGAALRWEGAGGSIVYFVGSHSEGHETIDDAPTQLRRLDLKSRTWLPPLLVGGPPKAGEDEQVEAVLAIAKYLAVLTRHGPHDSDTSDYRLSYFDSSADKPKWSFSLSGRGSNPDPGVALIAPSRPDFASSDLVQLSWLGDGVLVCAGPQADIVSLDAGGKILWKVSRIGEYQRGFIGPSVWSHHIGRFGFDWSETSIVNAPATRAASEKPPTEDELKYEAEVRKDYHDAKAAFANSYDWQIVAGPAIVPRKGGYDPTIFVVVARGPKGRYSGYLSDAIVYEISPARGLLDDPELAPSTMAQLPRLPVGPLFHVMNDGVVWACQDGGNGPAERRDPPS